MRRHLDSRWRSAVGLTLVLLVAALVPSPLRRHEGWEWVGPDKFLHLVGHAGYVLALAEALHIGRYSREEAAVFAVCLSTVHSLVTGHLQKRVPGRASELGDVVAGLVGAVLAASAWYLRNGPVSTDDTDDTDDTEDQSVTRTWLPPGL